MHAYAYTPQSESLCLQVHSGANVRGTWLRGTWPCDRAPWCMAHGAQTHLAHAILARKVSLARVDEDTRRLDHIKRAAPLVEVVHCASGGDACTGVRGCLCARELVRDGAVSRADAQQLLQPTHTQQPWRRRHSTAAAAAAMAARSCAYHRGRRADRAAAHSAGP